MMYDETFFTYDAASVVFDDSADGITTDEDSVSFDWDEVERVTIEDVPWADAFESSEFYKLPATVARPIPQRYIFGGDEMTLMKPRDELKRAAWSLDNAPLTLDHPNTGMVKRVDDVHGFFSDPHYIDSLDRLNTNLMLPVNDEEAKEHIEENGDVSVGFYNRLTSVDQYGGVVGGSDDDVDIDGYQTKMLFDHVASVSRGRCSSEHGCGIHDSPDVGVVEVVDGDEQIDYDPEPFVGSTETTDGTTLYERYDGSFIKGTVITHDYRDEDGTYYAVAPDENPDGVPKFPITSCSGEDSVDSAWRLRNHGDINISVETLEERIKRRASDLGCDSVPWDDEDSTTDTMTEETTDCGPSFDMDDLTVDAIAAQHDGVRAALDEKDERIDTLEDELEAASDAAERVEELEDEAEELREAVDEYEIAEKQELVDEILELTDRWDEDELMEADDELLEERKELLVDFEADEKNANGGGDETPDIRGPKRITPWN